MTWIDAKSAYKIYYLHIKPSKYMQKEEQYVQQKYEKTSPIRKRIL